jgi:hypothetical protein
MENNRDPVPKDMSIEEASEFWGTHSVADHPSRVVQFDFEQEGVMNFIAVANGLMSQLEKRAKETGVSIETLVNLWIQERLTA